MTILGKIVFLDDLSIKIKLNLPIDNIGTIEPREGILFVKFPDLLLHSEEKISH